MTDKVQKIKEWICKEQNGLMDAQGNFEYTEHEGAYHILCTLDAYIDSLQEEPVSEDLEKEIQDYYNSRREYGGRYNAVIPVYRHQLADIASHFAQWQKQQLMAKAVDATVHIDAGGYPYIPQMELYDYDKDIPLAKEGDKYKVILIKED